MNRLRNAFSIAIPSVALLVLGGCTDTRGRLDEARTKIAATLPAPYFEDLVTESVAVDGQRLVLTVRSPAGDAAKTREAPGFDALKESEQMALRDLCGLPEIAPLLDTDAVLARRFVDRDVALFFDVELPARDCANPPAEPSAQP